MTIVFDRRPALGDAPGTHALICGISAYRHLPGGGGEESRYSLGLTQLDSPSRTATALHDWLVEHADNLAAPLATSRLLLAPSPQEQADPGFAHHDVELPTLDAFLREAAAWRTDASTHRDGIAVLYIGGHGFVLSRSDQIVLLHDFGAPIGSVLRNAVNVESIFQGMAPSSFVPEIARTQLIFTDAGLPTPAGFASLPPEFAASSPTQVFDLPLDAAEDRVAVIFSSAPGEVAYGRVGGLTLFGEALFEGLNGAWAEQVETDQWAVTTVSLIEAVRDGLIRRSEEHGIRQDVIVGGLIGRAVIAHLTDKPRVELHIHLEPATAQPATMTLRDAGMETVHEAVVVDPKEPAVLDVPAGVYLLEVSRAGQTRTIPVSALRPSENLNVRLDP